MKSVRVVRLALVASVLLSASLAWSQGGNPPASTKESGQTSGHGMTAAEQTGEGKGASTSSPSAAKNLESKIRQMWEEFKAKKKDAFAAELAEGDTEIWADGKGAHDKATTLREMDNYNVNSYSLSNFKITQLGPDAALATYQAKTEGTLNGQSFNSKLDVTNVFVKRGGEWKELRYHESEIK